MTGARLFRDAKSLIKHLLESDVNKRYGNLKRGIQDIKNHRWFEQLDWEFLEQKRLIPIYVPKVSGKDDTIHFTEYVDDTDADMAVPHKEDPFQDW